MQCLNIPIFKKMFFWRKEDTRTHNHTHISSGWLSHLFFGTCWYCFIQNLAFTQQKDYTLLKLTAPHPWVGEDFLPQVATKTPQRNWNESSSTHEFSGANLLLVSWCQLRRVPFHRLIEACWVLWWLGYRSSLSLYQWCLDNSLELLDDKFWLDNFNKKLRKPTLPSSMPSTKNETYLKPQPRSSSLCSFLINHSHPFSSSRSVWTRCSG